MILFITFIYLFIYLYIPLANFQSIIVIEANKW